MAPSQKRVMWLIVSETIEEAAPGGYAYSFCGPVFTTNVSEWMVVGLNNVHSQGAERFLSAQRCEVKGVLHSVAIKTGGSV